MKGCYILVINNLDNQKIRIGSLGDLTFKKGFYVYIGSALNNLDKRIKRHLRSDKKFHWHIDYLLEKSEIIEVYFKENMIKEECDVAQQFSQNFERISGFGCSDCSCNSHLFYCFDKKIIGFCNSLNFVEYVI